MPKRHGVSCSHVSSLYFVRTGGAADSRAGPVCRSRQPCADPVSGKAQPEGCHAIWPSVRRTHAFAGGVHLSEVLQQYGGRKNAEMVRCSGAHALLRCLDGCHDKGAWSAESLCSV